VLPNFGKKVKVLGARDRVLARVAGEPLSRFYKAKHRAHGVDVRLGVTVERTEEKNNRAEGVRLAGGQIVEAEMVIVGIGIVTAIEPPLAAGAEGGNDVAVDKHGRTTLQIIDPGIVVKAGHRCWEHCTHGNAISRLFAQDVDHETKPDIVVAQTFERVVDAAASNHLDVRHDGLLCAKGEHFRGSRVPPAPELAKLRRPDAKR